MSIHRFVPIELGGYLNVPATRVDFADGMANEAAHADTIVPMVAYNLGSAALDPDFDIKAYLKLSNPPSINGELDGFLSRPSHYHRRAWDGPPRDVFSDEYGNEFTRVGFKGNDCTHNHLHWSATANHGWIPYGKMDDGAAPRIRGASSLLRQAGVDTEWVRSFARPEYVLVNGEPTDMKDYKQLVVQKTRQDHNYNPNILEATFEPGEMVVMERAMLTSHRLNDFFTDTNKARLADRLEQIFDIYNRVIGPKEPAGLPAVLDPESSRSVRAYFEEVLPGLLGSNIAKAHDIDAFHKYLYLGNITALGGLVDLDSVGAPSLGFGDRRPSPRQQERDLYYQFARDKYRFSMSTTTTTTDLFDHLAYLRLYEDSKKAAYAGFRYRENMETAYLMTRKKPDKRVALDIIDEWFEAPDEVESHVLGLVSDSSVQSKIVDGIFTLWLNHRSGRYFQVGPSIDTVALAEMTQPSIYPIIYMGSELQEFALPNGLLPPRINGREIMATELSRRVFAQMLAGAMNSES